MQNNTGTLNIGNVSGRTIMKRLAAACLVSQIGQFSSIAVVRGERHEIVRLFDLILRFLSCPFGERRLVASLRDSELYPTWFSPLRMCCTVASRSVKIASMQQESPVLLRDGQDSPLESIQDAASLLL